MKINVTCYSGYRADEIPRSIRFDSLEVKIKDVQDQWVGPDHRYFKVLGDDDACYIIRQNTVSHQWELTYFRAAELDPGEPEDR